MSVEGKVYGGGVYDGAFNTSLVHDQNLIERAPSVIAIAVDSLSEGFPIGWRLPGRSLKVSDSQLS